MATRVQLHINKKGYVVAKKVKKKYKIKFFKDEKPGKVSPDL